MPVSFVRHGDDYLIRKYFKLVSSVYSDDFDLTRFMKNLIFDHQKWKSEDCQIGRIEKTLVILRDIGRINVAAALSRFVLLRYSEIFQQDENIDIRSSMEKMGMTGLHGMAYRGDLNSIEKEIDCSLEKPEIYTEDVKKSVLQQMMGEKDFVSPFEVTAAYGHEEICRKIIKFLPANMNDDRGNCFDTLIDAIKIYDNVVMFRTIWKSFRAVWVQKALIQLLKPLFRHYFHTGTPEEQTFKTMLSFVVEDKENCYRDLNDLVFQNHFLGEIQKLEHIPCDILRGMIDEEGGFEDWMKRLMDTDITGAFWVLTSDGFLDKLDQEDHIPKLIDFIMKPSKEGETSSYWSEFVKNEFSNPYEFIKVVAKRFGDDDLKRLLFVRDGNNIIVFLLLIQEGRDWIEKIFPIFPENLKKEIEDLFGKEKHQLMDHYFSSPTFSKFSGSQKPLNAIEFYLENGNDEQLSKFCQVVDVHQLETTLADVARYGVGERCKKIVKLLKEKMGNTTVIYNNLIEKYLTEFNEKKVDD